MADNFQITQMNPFERLRQTIDKVNIVYQFDEPEQNQAVRDVPVSQPVRQTQVQAINDPDELSRIKDLYSNTQTSHIKQINALTSKLEQVTKSLKRAQATVQVQMNDIVSLQKENELLKENLNEQYRNIVAHDEKERKLKEEIYRINVTVNQLAGQINMERATKKQLIRDSQNSKNQLNKTIELLKEQIKKVQGERDNFKSELEERIEMFEYNVKKNADDRKQYKNQIIKLQENYENTLNGYRMEIDKIKQELFEAKKQAQILNLRKKNVQQNCERIGISLGEYKEKNKKLEEQLQIVSKRYEQSIKNNEVLEQNNSSLGSQLEQQRKNIKIKVVEVRDETVLMELQMYKRQCKQLMQQKAIINTLQRSERSIQPGYKIINENNK